MKKNTRWVPVSVIVRDKQRVDVLSYIYMLLPLEISYPFLLRSCLLLFVAFYRSHPNLICISGPQRRVRQQQVNAAQIAVGKASYGGNGSTGGTGSPSFSRGEGERVPVH
jgi:hypothetical protein